MIRTGRFLFFTLLLGPSVWLAVSYGDMPLFGRYFDDGLYLSSAKGIAQGRGYRIMNLPGEPPEVKYPPLVPFVMAAAWKLQKSFPSVLGVASWLAWLPFPVVLSTCYCWLRMLPLSPWSISAALLTLSFNYHLLLQSRMLMTDLWGLVFLLSALLAAAHERSVLSGLATSAACLARIACVPVLGAIGLWFLWRKRYREAFLFGVTATPALIWWYLRKALLSAPKADDFVSAYSEYGDYLQPSRLIDNLPSFGASLGWLFLSSGAETAWIHFLVPVLVAVGIVGLVRIWKSCSTVRPYVCFAIVYSSIVLCWGFKPGPRFLIPLLPLFAAGVVFESERMARLLRESWRNGQRAVPLITFALFACVPSALLYSGIYGVVVQMPHDFAADRVVRQRIQPF